MHHTAEGPRHLHDDAGASFICSDEVTVAGSIVYVLGGYVLEFYRSSKGGNCSRCCPNYRMEQHVFVYLVGGLCKIVRMGPRSSPAWQGHVAAAERVCMNLHIFNKVLPWDNELRDFV
jgi:hypothetical protein